MTSLVVANARVALAELQRLAVAGVDLARHAMGRREIIRAKIYACVEVVDCGYKTPCHLWTGPTSGDGRGGGYPRMNLGGQTVAVHKVKLLRELAAAVIAAKRTKPDANGFLTLRVKVHIDDYEAAHLL